MSILSDRTDGFGFYYGFLPGDHRQINVRRQTSADGFITWRAYVGGKDIGPFDSKYQAEQAATAWAKENREP